MNYCMVMTTCAESAEAERIAIGLVDQKLAACVQISKITSYYTWKGQTHNDPEYRLLIKAPSNLYNRIEQCIKDMHSYEVPEIIQIPIQAGFKEYLDWIAEVTD